MLEAIGIPILLKAVDFLFTEGNKILQERRKRRQEEKKKSGANVEDAKPTSTRTDVADVINSREAALKLTVDEAVWSDTEAEIDHLVNLLEIHTRNFHLAREQYAKWGSAMVPPIIVNNLEEAEDAVAETMKELKDVLSRVYGQEITTSEIEAA